MHYIKNSFLFLFLSAGVLCASSQDIVRFFSPEESGVIGDLFLSYNELSENVIISQLHTILIDQNKMNFFDRNTGETCLHRACQFLKPEVVRWLIGNGARSYQDRGGRHPIHFVASKNIFDVFSDAELDINVKNAANETLLDQTSRRMRNILSSCANHNEELDRNSPCHQRLREFGRYIKRFGAKRARELVKR